jgi:hypothetical protein
MAVCVSASCLICTNVLSVTTNRRSLCHFKRFLKKKKKKAWCKHAFISPCSRIHWKVTYSCTSITHAYVYHHHHRLDSPVWALALFKSFLHSSPFNAKFFRPKSVRPAVAFSDLFLRDGVVSLTPNAQPGEPGLRIYVPRRKGGPAILPGTGFPLLTRRGTVRLFFSAATRRLIMSIEIENLEEGEWDKEMGTTGNGNNQKRRKGH